MTRQTERSPIGTADRGARWWRGGLLLLVLAWPLFGHGCHSGDHDDELVLIPPEVVTKADDSP